MKTIGAQIVEIFAIHHRCDKKAAAAETLGLLSTVGFRDSALRVAQYPHELSGGMRQRVLIAIALALRPGVIIADEPTSALDVTVQKHILDLLDRLRRDFDTAVLLVTHDLGVAADRASRVVVMQQGEIKEQGSTAALLRDPAHPYTRQLLADAPSLSVSSRAPVVSDMDYLAGAEYVIEADNLCQTFPGQGKAAPFIALDDVSFHVRRGETHALVGESGAGKTTCIRCVLGFLQPAKGSVRIGGASIDSLKGEAHRQFRRTIQLVYQNPFTSLDPRQTVAQIIEEPLLNFGFNAADRKARLKELLDQVSLSAAQAARTAAMLSGGQRQRVAIARALSLRPHILVLNEPVSALDVTVQAQILRLLDDLQRTLHLTYLFVSHDLAVVRQIADTVTVLQGGRVVEKGDTANVFASPQQVYTKELINAIPGKGANL